MRYLLTLNMDPVIWESLSDRARSAVYAGHEAFQKAITEAGEFAGTLALAGPEESTTVRVRNGAATAADGLLAAGRAHLCGYYLVECDSKKRAVELASLIPDAQYTAVEVRAVVHGSGPGE